MVPLRPTVLGLACLTWFGLVLPSTGRPSHVQAFGQQQARDIAVRVARPGSGAVSGRVVTLDSGVPVKRARVVASGTAAQGTRAVFTDENGKYQITRLAAGTIVISASKDGLLTTSFGQSSWPGNGTSLTLREGQRIDQVDIALPRGGVLTGRVLDEGGEALVGATVRASRVTWVNGEMRAAPGGTDVSDDRGVYRVFGLTPGTYYLSAMRARDVTDPRVAGDTEAQDGSGTPTGYAATYHLSGANLAEATPVRVRAGQETGGIDVNVRLVPVVEVSGIATSSNTAGRISVRLLPDEQEGFGPPALDAVVSRDGAFRAGDVPPGRYLVFAQEIGSASNGGSRGLGKLQFAVQSLEVGGRNVTGLAMTLGSGGTVTGNVTFEATKSPPPTNFAGFRVMATGVRSSLGVGAPVSQVRADGTFTIESIPPLPVLLDAAVPARIAGSREGQSWRVKAIYLNGQDISDVPIEVRPGQSLSGVVVVFSDSVSGLSGEVRDGSQPAANCAVVVFSVDATLWRTPQSRYLRMTRTDVAGRFDIRPLPPGPYCVRALKDIDPLQWSNPDVLERLRADASTVTVIENETRSINLVLGAR